MVSEEGIRADLTAIAKQAKAVRTYGSNKGLAHVPEIARELGLTVTLGIWLDKDKARNEREIATALDLARHYPNVTRLVVGNETYLRHEHTAAELVKIIRRVKRDSPVPVATADHWKTFIDHPELVDADDWKAASLAVLVGLLLSLTILALPGATIGQATLLAAADHMAGHWCASVLVYWHVHYFLYGEAITFAIALPLLGLLAPIVRSRLNEMATVTLGREPTRLLGVSSPAPAANAPKVSVHIPAYREPPDMLLRTIDSVARLDYPNFECVVVINNTPDPAFWQPIERRCRELGPRFKFVCVENLRGFKAAALRLAMAETADDAEIIGVIDADYVVDQ